MRSTPRGRRGWRAASFALVFVVLLAAGCGDDAADDGATETDTPTAPEPTGTTPEPTTPAPTTEPTTPAPTTEPTEGPTTPDETATAEVEVFFANDELGDPCGEVFPVTREVEAMTPIRGALLALLEGPTEAEEAEGYGGWFSEDTADMLRSVAVADGTARVDFGDLPSVIPNASTSCGSAGLLAQLDETLLQFDDEVERTVYMLDGDVDAFYEWLQMSAPE